MQSNQSEEVPTLTIYCLQICWKYAGKHCLLTDKSSSLSSWTRFGTKILFKPFLTKSWKILQGSPGNHKYVHQKIWARLPRVSAGSAASFLIPGLWLIRVTVTRRALPSWFMSLSCHHRLPLAFPCGAASLCCSLTMQSAITFPSGLLHDRCVLSINSYLLYMVLQCS